MKRDKTTRAIAAVKKILGTLTGQQRALVLASLVPALPPAVDADETRANIERALAACNNAMDRTAVVLGWSRRTLQNRMRQLGMARVKNGCPNKRSTPVGDAS
jgi:DNA-binding NtrC family response regulator